MLWHIRVGLTAIAALLTSTSVLAQAPDRDLRPRTASISGLVTISGKPSANVTVTVTEDHSGIREARIYSLGGRDFVDPYFYKTTTDSQGRYQIGGLPTGTYLVAPRAPAHTPESKFLGLDSAIKITLDEGEAREKVDFALVRGGVITGRVTDEDGRPQIGRTVRLMELIDQDKHRETPELYGRGLETDDRGIYRIFGLRSGRYIVKAGGENDAPRRMFRGKKTEVTYHPDVLRLVEATVIEVGEGTEAIGVDIRVRDPVKSFTVSGRVIDSETGKPLPNVNINCFSVENQEAEFGNSVANPMTDAEGNFIATGLKPGKYKAKLSPPFEGGEYYSESKFFEVNDGDVIGVEIPARRGAIINGRVIVEEGGSASSQTRLSRTTLYADVYKDLFVGTNRGHMTVGRARSKVGSDGGFRIIGLPPGKVRTRLAADSSNPFYQLRIERDGISVGDALEVGPGEEVNNVRLIFGHGSGSIRGLLKVAGGNLPEGVRLSVYATREEPTQVGASGEVDDKGRFVIRGLLTGEYSLGVSWGMKYYPPAGQYPKIPQFPRQRVSVTNGAETQVNLTYDLSRKEEEKK